MKKNTVFSLLHIISALFTILLAFSSAVCFDRYSAARGISLIATLFVMLYAIFFYKKPHGNMLRYTMLLLAFGMIFAMRGAFSAERHVYFEASSLMIAFGAICYCAGRLHKVAQNRFLFAFIAASLIVNYVLRISGSSDIKGPFQYIAAASYLINFGTLSLAYFSRYREHIQAGLEKDDEESE